MGGNETYSTNLIGFYALCQACRCTFGHCVKNRAIKAKPDSSKVLIAQVRCPKCGSDLEEINLQSVFIDKCNQCGGIWLDHGELELLVDGQAKMTKGLLKRLFA